MQVPNEKAAAAKIQSSASALPHAGGNNSSEEKKLCSEPLISELNKQSASTLHVSALTVPTLPPAVLV